MQISKININDEKYPQRLLKIKGPPSEIYVLGNAALLNADHTLGIVGTRKCTEYGRRVTNSFAKEIAAKGICIISGLATGIDELAHNVATDENGKTIAVLGSGFDNIYPKENEWLFYKIIQKEGCVISEYPPNTIPDKSNFPVRNRIISGLSDALLVVEANYRSGSSITAKYAKAEGKTIYAIPNTIYATEGIGTNRLIKEGATLVTKHEEILEAYHVKEIKNKEELKYENKAKTSNLKKVNTENQVERKILSEEYLQIYQILSDKPIHINEIAKILSKSISEIIPIITMLEIEEYIYQPITNYFIKNIDEISKK